MVCECISVALLTHCSSLMQLLLHFEGRITGWDMDVRLVQAPEKGEE